jgi:serine/alanine adding enzyme
MMTLNEAVSGALTEPTPSDWDQFVLAHPHGHALQSAAWGEVKRSSGWLPRLIAVTDQGTIRGGALLLIRRRAGLSVVYAPRGPLLTGDPALDRLLLQGIVRIGRQARAVFVRLEPNILDQGASALHSWLLAAQFQSAEPTQPRSSVHLDLVPPADALLASMSKGHRADVRRAAREGCVVAQATDAAGFAQFYDILTATSQRNQFGIHSAEYYRQVCAQFGDAAQVWVATRDGAAEAAALTVGWGPDALYLYSGSTEAGLRSGAQHAIQWEVIRWAQARGCRRYDFWGVPDQFGVAAQEPDADERARLEQQATTDPLFGVYRFKKGFGGRVVRYLPAYDRVLMWPLYAIWRRRAAQ